MEKRKEKDRESMRLIGSIMKSKGRSGRIDSEWK